MSNARSHLLIKRAVFTAMLMTLVSFDSVAVTPVPCGESEFEPPCPPVLEILEGEVNQGLRGYSQVAGKDTLVRVFVSVAPSLVFTFPLSIDRAELDVKNTTAGSLLTVAAAVIQNPITNITQQFSEKNNVNFYLDGSTLPAGDYQFTARLYSNSATPIKEFDFGAIYPFIATPPLRLLIVFGDDPKTGLDDLHMEPDLRKDPVLWDYIRQHILPTISRIYPISSGVGTIDTSGDCSGDRTSGLRYFVYPDAVDTDDWRNGLDALRRFNLMLMRSAGTCDQAHNVTMLVRNRDNCLIPGKRDSCTGYDFFHGVEGGTGPAAHPAYGLP